MNVLSTNIMFPDTVDFLENFAEKKLFVSIKKTKKNNLEPSQGLWIITVRYN